MAAPTPPTEFPPGYLEEYTGDRVLAANTVILIASTILLALRLYARSLTRATRGWDEFLLVPAWIFLLGLIICLYRRLLFGNSSCIMQTFDPPMSFLALTLSLY